MRKVIAMITAVVGIILAAAGIYLKTKKSHAIGIIGGADGPTSIFVAGRIGDGFPIGALVIGLALIIVGIIIWRRFRKK